MAESMPRLLDCGHCYEENGEEVHPHPECSIGYADPDYTIPRIREEFNERFQLV